MTINVREKQWTTLCCTEDNRYILIFLDINTDVCLYGLAGLHSTYARNEWDGSGQGLIEDN